MTMPTLSVIVPNYNHGGYVGEALEAIVSQSLPPAEVVVVDDASTDNSVEVIERFVTGDGIVRLLRNPRNLGTLGAVNRALKHISGDFIYFASANDVILPGFFEKTTKLLSRHPGAAMCCTDTKSLRADTGAVIVNNQELGDAPCFISPEELVAIMEKRIVYLSSFAALIGHGALKEAGGFITELAWSIDRFFSVVIALRHGLCYIPEPLALHQWSAHSFGVRGIKSGRPHRDVIRNMLRLLRSPAYSDVLPRFKKASALALGYGMPMLRVLVRDREFREFLTPRLVQRILWSEFRTAMGEAAPSFVKPPYRTLRDRWNG